jgi:hypothetical protein
MITEITLKPFEICNYPDCKLRFNNGVNFPCLGMDIERNTIFYCSIDKDKRGEKYVKGD